MLYVYRIIYMCIYICVIWYACDNVVQIFGLMEIAQSSNPRPLCTGLPRWQFWPRDRVLPDEISVSCWTSKWWLMIINVTSSKVARINDQFLEGLYHPFRVILEMVCYFALLTLGVSISSLFSMHVLSRPSNTIQVDASNSLVASSVRSLFQRSQWLWQKKKSGAMEALKKW